MLTIPKYLDFLEVARGSVESLSVRGEIVVCVPKSFIAPDIYVLLEWVRASAAHPYDDETFKTEVIQLLKRKGKLDPKKRYELTRAEIGMQDALWAVFEVLLERDGPGKRARNVTRQFSLDNGSKEETTVGGRKEG